MVSHGVILTAFRVPAAQAHAEVGSIQGHVRDALGLFDGIRHPRACVLKECAATEIRPYAAAKQH